MLCCSRMSLTHPTENMASLSVPFIKRYSRKTIKKETRLPEFCLNPRRHELNLAQHINLDSCNFRDQNKYKIFLMHRNYYQQSITIHLNQFTTPLSD